MSGHFFIKKVGEMFVKTCCSGCDLMRSCLLSIINDGICLKMVEW